uniref:Uncharacterized protein MANES_16G110100 n=1 Tax=Rhizophora mucronata TaxID=61149 RepID=A0A2P2PJA4_RHIMU
MLKASFLLWRLKLKK